MWWSGFRLGSQMKLDPQQWPERVMLTVPFGLFASVGGFIVLWPHSPITLGLATIAPGVFGALIWRFDGIPWRHILSWTTPLTGLVLVAYLILPGFVPRIAAGIVAIAWLATFIFWQPPARWWYRLVLRTEPPRFSRSEVGFARQFQAVESEFRQTLLRLEHDWRAGRTNDADFRGELRRLGEPLRRLEPPAGPWRDVLAERLAILAGWESVFEAPGEVSDQTYEDLGAMEDRLRTRVRELAQLD